MWFSQSRSMAALAGFLLTASGHDGLSTSTPGLAAQAYPIYNALLRNYVDGDKRAIVSIVRYTQVQLSAPGISEDGQLSIVYLAIAFAGDFRVLQKAGSKWIVQRTVCGWMS